MENEGCEETAGNPLVLDKSDGDLSTEPVQETGDKVEDVACEPSSQGGSSNDTCVVNSSSDDGRFHICTELDVKSAESEIKRTGDAPSISSGSLQEVEEKEVSNPPTEVCVKLIENGDINDSGKMDVEVCSSQSLPPLEVSSTEESREIVKSNDVQSAICACL